MPTGHSDAGTYSFESQKTPSCKKLIEKAKQGSHILENDCERII